MNVVAGLAALAACACQETLPLCPAKHPVPEAQDRCDRLSPLMSPVSTEGHQAYNAAVARTLFSRLRQREESGEELLLAMFLVTIPRPQEAVYVLIPPGPTTSRSRFRVVYAKARKVIPYAGGVVEADFFEAFLDWATVQALERVWSTMTASARWRTRSEVLPSAEPVTFGPGMSMFIFDYQGDHNVSQGLVYSPVNGSCTAALTSIGNALARFAESRKENQPRRKAALVREIEQLSRRLGLTEADSCGGSPCQTTDYSQGSR